MKHLFLIAFMLCPFQSISIKPNIPAEPTLFYSPPNTISAFCITEYLAIVKSILAYGATFPSRERDAENIAIDLYRMIFDDTDSLERQELLAIYANITPPPVTQNNFMCFLMGLHLNMLKNIFNFANNMGGDKIRKLKETLPLFFAFNLISSNDFDSVERNQIPTILQTDLDEWTLKMTKSVDDLFIWQDPSQLHYMAALCEDLSNQFLSPASY